MPRPKKAASAPRGAASRKAPAKSPARISAKTGVKHRAKSRGRKTAGARGAAPLRAALSELSTDALAAELARRRSELPRLEQQAAALRAQLAALESRIAFLSGDAAAGPARAAAKMRDATRDATRDAARDAAPERLAPRGGTEGKRGPRLRRDGRPTLAVLIGRILDDSRDALALREIAERAARALGRAVNPSFLVQTSQTLRKLVVRGAAEQAARGMYARGADASREAKEGTHADEQARPHE